MLCSNAASDDFLAPIVIIETVIAVVTTLYVLIRYLVFLFSTLKGEPQE
jgi:hypothetical protein